jgi:hypothetical protein
MPSAETNRENGKLGGKRGRPREKISGKVGATMLRNNGIKFASDIIDLERDIMHMFREQQEMEHDLEKLYKLSQDSSLDDLTLLQIAGQINDIRKVKLDIAAELRLQLKEILPYLFPKAPPSEWGDEDEQWKNTTDQLRRIWEAQNDNRNSDSDARADAVDIS